MNQDGRTPLLKAPAAVTHIPVWDSAALSDRPGVLPLLPLTHPAPARSINGPGCQETTHQRQDGKGVENRQIWLVREWGRTTDKLYDNIQSDRTR